jgi:hypothetical protein
MASPVPGGDDRDRSPGAGKSGTARPTSPAAFLSDHRTIRSLQRWLYRVAWGEDPEETDYLKDFPIEADVFPKVRRHPS